VTELPTSDSMKNCTKSRMRGVLGSRFFPRLVRIPATASSSGTKRRSFRNSPAAWATARWEEYTSSYTCSQSLSVKISRWCLIKKKPWPCKISGFHGRWLWRMASSGILCNVGLVRTDVSEELSAPFIRVTRIGELGTLAVTSNRHTPFFKPWPNFKFISPPIFWSISLCSLLETCMFQRNTSPSSSELKNKTSNKQAWSRYGAHCASHGCLACLLLDIKDGWAVSPKQWLTFNRPHSDICRQIGLFTPNTVTASNPSQRKLQVNTWGALGKGNTLQVCRIYDQHNAYMHSIAMVLLCLRHE
jgi:hypothetical protein